VLIVSALLPCGNFLDQGLLIGNAPIGDLDMPPTLKRANPQAGQTS
jgi:hypothetical protein